MATVPLVLGIDCLKYIGKADLNTEAVLDDLCIQASAAIENYLNRALLSSSQIESRDGNGSRRMMLANWPVTSVQSVAVNGNPIPAAVGYTGSGYRFAMGGRALILQGYAFDEGCRNVDLAYTAGFNDAGGLYPLPEDIQLACIQYAVLRYNERTRIGQNSKTLAGETATFTGETMGSGKSAGMPSAVRSILANYANVIPETGC